MEERERNLFFKKSSRPRKISGFNWLSTNPFASRGGVKGDSPFSTPMLTPRSGEWRDLLTLILPLTFCLVLLSLISLYFVKFPGAGQELITAFVPSAPRVPPSGLYIADSSYKKVFLDSGEEVGIISGTLRNETSESFHAVQLEGQLFNTEGRVVKRAMANAASNLGQTRIRSLSPQMISSLQSARTPRRFSLPHGEEQDFTIALLGDELKKAAYFSVRVYSVKSSS